MASNISKPCEPPTPKYLDQRKPEKRGEMAKKLLSFTLKDDPTKTVQIEASLLEPIWDRLLNFLYQNVDIFTWSAFDMPRIPLKIITHKLNANPKFKQV